MSAISTLAQVNQLYVHIRYCDTNNFLSCRRDNGCTGTRRNGVPPLNSNQSRRPRFVSYLSQLQGVTFAYPLNFALYSVHTYDILMLDAS